jgi:hypothetical protein
MITVLKDIGERNLAFHTTAPEKRVGGKYKGRFKIKEGFDQLPDDFMAALEYHS